MWLQIKLCLPTHTRYVGALYEEKKLILKVPLELGIMEQVKMI